MRGRFSLLELVTVVAIVMVLAAIAIPQLYVMQLRAKRAEVPTNVDGLITAQEAYHAANDRYAIDEGPPSMCPSTLPGKQKRPFDDGSAACQNLISQLGWQPDGDVYGWYGGSQHVGGGQTGGTCACGSDTEWVNAEGISDVDGTDAQALYFDCRPAAAATSTGWCTGTDVY